MISRIRGTLKQVGDQSALVENNGVYYEVMVPTALAERLKDDNRIDTEIEFETIYYIEAGDKKSSHYPRLVGFTEKIDREFFSLFTQVPGLGVKKALKSLIIPIKDIASAIETKDSARLTKLPGVGGRLAEKIIAELHGKTAKFALSRNEQPLAVAKTKPSPFVEEALEVLMQLQYTRHEAEKMIERVYQSKPKISCAQDLITLIFRTQQQDKAVG